jgi:hypothetical protein
VQLKAKMIERVRKLWRRHPPSQHFSLYIDGELPLAQRRALEAHVRDCAHCRGLQLSLARTVEGLGSLAAPAPAGIADSVIAALRSESSPIAARDDLQPGLTVVTPSDALPGRVGWRDRARAALAFCCQRRQLRATLPLALLVGVVLTVVNQGGMLFHGQVDLGMCAMCASDFVVPFVALNVALLMLVRPAGRRRL